MVKLAEFIPDSFLLERRQDKIESLDMIECQLLCRDHNALRSSLLLFSPFLISSIKDKFIISYQKD